MITVHFEPMRMWSDLHLCLENGYLTIYHSTTTGKLWWRSFDVMKSTRAATKHSFSWVCFPSLVLHFLMSANFISRAKEFSNYALYINPTIRQPIQCSISFTNAKALPSARLHSWLLSCCQARDHSFIQGGLKKKNASQKCPFISQEAKTIDVNVSATDGQNNETIPWKKM